MKILRKTTFNVKNMVSMTEMSFLTSGQEEQEAGTNSEQETAVSFSFIMSLQFKDIFSNIVAKDTLYQNIPILIYHIFFIIFSS